MATYLSSQRQRRFNNNHNNHTNTNFVSQNIGTSNNSSHYARNARSQSLPPYLPSQRPEIDTISPNRSQYEHVNIIIRITDILLTLYLVHRESTNSNDIDQ